MSTSQQSLRKDALDFFQAGIAAADPALAVSNCLTVAENHFEISLELNNPNKKRIGRWSKIHLIAFGKAACKMIKAAEAIIPKHRLASRPIAITNYQNKTALKNVTVIAAGHPIPDESGLEATKSVVEQLKNTEQGELVLTLISGGGSALLPYPASGITLADKQKTTDLLLASGANIQQINCVRKHLSQIKGGYLAKYAAPADLHALILSDVLGDDLSTIASGPTEPDNTTFSEAIKILEDLNIWHKTPKNIQTLLANGALGSICETPKSDANFFRNSSHTLVGSNTLSLNAMIAAAKKASYAIDIYSLHLSGESREIAEQLVIYAKQLIAQGLFQNTAIIAGGETTVTIQGKGKGGRNQEMALAFALAAEKYPLKGQWVFLSGGTDGRDGPTDAAGGIVDSGTIQRIKDTKANPLNRLNNNDSYAALKKSGDLVITGATGTNVADLQILLIQPE